MRVKPRTQQKIRTRTMIVSTNGRTLFEGIECGPEYLRTQIIKYSELAEKTNWVLRTHVTNIAHHHVGSRRDGCDPFETETTYTWYHMGCPTGVPDSNISPWDGYLDSLNEYLDLQKNESATELTLRFFGEIPKLRRI